MRQDFGIARAAGETGITSTGATIGTWSYMAPERFSSGEVEPSSDIYALTCVLYQSLTGQLPFPGTTMEQVAMAHMTAPPPKPSAQRHGIPMAVDDVIATGLAKDPRQRYSTPKDLAQAARRALSQAQADTSMADTQAAPTSPAPVGPPAPKVDAAPSRNGPGDQKPRKTWLIATAAAVVAVILIAGLIALWRPWERKTVPSARESPGSASSLAQVPPQVTVTTTAQPPPLPALPTPPPSVTVQPTPLTPPTRDLQPFDPGWPTDPRFNYGEAGPHDSRFAYGVTPGEPCGNEPQQFAYTTEATHGAIATCLSPNGNGHGTWILVSSWGEFDGVHSHGSLCDRGGTAMSLDGRQLLCVTGANATTGTWEYGS